MLLDGRPDGASAQIFAVAQERDRAAGAARGQGVAFAIGNKINHPPQGVQPNVVVHPLDLMADEHTQLHAFLPVCHFRPPAAGQASKQTAVFIATRALHDEELFLDYKRPPHVGSRARLHCTRWMHGWLPDESYACGSCGPKAAVGLPSLVRVCAHPPAQHCAALRGRTAWPHCVAALLGRTAWPHCLAALLGRLREDGPLAPWYCPVHRTAT